MGRRLFVMLSGLALVAGLGGCLWGTATVGGTLSGLPSGSSVVLQNNGADDLTLQADGRFEFAQTLDKDEAYAVTVKTQPAGGTCTVANGSGTIDSSSNAVTNVTVTCTSSGSLTGTVSGLTAGAFVTLINGSDTLAVTANGSFTFPGVLAAGTAYNVTVSQNPVNLTCTVANGSGTVVTGTPTAIAVTCVP